MNWPQHLYSPTDTSANMAAMAITQANAANLTVAWHFAPGKGPPGLQAYTVGG